MAALAAKIQRFMAGRRGVDQLTCFLFLLYLLLHCISLFTRLAVLSILALVCLALAVFRMLSRNLTRRQQENERFLGIATPALRWFRWQRRVLSDRDHRYFKCPSCGQPLRVPRGKGRIHITCRTCGASFDKKA